jgi:hypothetical protein
VGVRSSCTSVMSLRGGVFCVHRDAAHRCSGARLGKCRQPVRPAHTACRHQWRCRSGPAGVCGPPLGLVSDPDQPHVRSSRDAERYRYAGTASTDTSTPCRSLLGSLRCLMATENHLAPVKPSTSIYVAQDRLAMRRRDLGRRRPIRYASKLRCRPSAQRNRPQFAQSVGSLASIAKGLQRRP